MHLLTKLAKLLKLTSAALEPELYSDPIKPTTQPYIKETQYITSKETYRPDGTSYSVTSLDLPKSQYEKIYGEYKYVVYIPKMKRILDENKFNRGAIYKMRTKEEVLKYNGYYYTSTTFFFNDHANALNFFIKHSGLSK